MFTTDVTATTIIRMGHQRIVQHLRIKEVVQNGDDPVVMELHYLRMSNMVCEYKHCRESCEGTRRTATSQIEDQDDLSFFSEEGEATLVPPIACTTKRP